METLAVEECDGPPHGSAVRKVLAKGAFSFFKVRLGDTGDHPGEIDDRRGFVLFDLTHPQVEPGRHSVVYRTRSWDRFRFWVVTDTHVAEMWDRIQTGFQRSGQRRRALRPCPVPAIETRSRQEIVRGQLFESQPESRPVHPAGDERASRGDLDFVILGGDVVDYQFRIFDRPEARVCGQQFDSFRKDRDRPIRAR